MISRTAMSLGQIIKRKKAIKFKGSLTYILWDSNAPFCFLFVPGVNPVLNRQFSNNAKSIKR